MTTEQPTPQIDWNQFSPATMWRDWIVKSEAQWSETVSQLLKDERSGGVLKKQVDEARMAHRQFGEMAQADARDLFAVLVRIQAAMPGSRLRSVRPVGGDA